MAKKVIKKVPQKKLVKKTVRRRKTAKRGGKGPNYNAALGSNLAEMGNETLIDTISVINNYLKNNKNLSDGFKEYLVKKGVIQKNFLNEGGMNNIANKVKNATSYDQKFYIFMFKQYLKDKDLKNKPNYANFRAMYSNLNKNYGINNEYKNYNQNMVDESVVEKVNVVRNNNSGNMNNKSVRVNNITINNNSNKKNNSNKNSNNSIKKNNSSNNLNKKNNSSNNSNKKNNSSNNSNKNSNNSSLVTGGKRKVVRRKKIAKKTIRKPSKK